MCGAARGKYEALAVKEGFSYRRTNTGVSNPHTTRMSTSRSLTFLLIGHSNVHTNLNSIYSWWSCWMWSTWLKSQQYHKRLGNRIMHSGKGSVLRYKPAFSKDHQDNVREKMGEICKKKAEADFLPTGFPAACPLSSKLQEIATLQLLWWINSECQGGEQNVSTHVLLTFDGL